MRLSSWTSPRRDDSEQEGIGNPLTNFSLGVRGYWQPSDKFLRGYSNFCKYHIIARGLPIPSNPRPEGIDYPPEQLSEGVG